MDLTGQTILVTGGGGNGVGSGVCRAVIEAGASLVLHERDQHDADRAGERLGAVATYAADLASHDEVEAMFSGIASRFERLDGVVNNAGIGLGKRAHEASTAEYDRLHAVDGRGAWLVCRSFTTLAIARGSRGSIVNVSSVHAHATIRGYALYAAAKGGLEALTRGLAVELGEHGIRCNAIAPGYVHSDQNLDLIRTWSSDPTGWAEEHVRDQQAIARRVEPIDCGWAAVFFLSQRSRAITGQVLRVDAGTTSMLYDKAFV